MVHLQFSGLENKGIFLYFSSSLLWILFFKISYKYNRHSHLKIIADHIMFIHPGRIMRNILVSYSTFKIKRWEISIPPWECTASHIEQERLWENWARITGPTDPPVNIREVTFPTHPSRGLLYSNVTLLFTLYLSEL